MEAPEHTEFSNEKPPSKDAVQTLSPVLRLSSQHNGSNLLDSFELRAVTHQLNKAMLASSRSSPTYLKYINSPFYRHQLDSMYRENVNTPRRIVCSGMSGTDLSRGKRPASRGFISRLWKKVKQGLLWNKQ